MPKNKVFLNDDDIVEIHVVGDQTQASVLAMGKLAEDLLKELAQKKQPALILDDITQMGKTDTPARQAVQKLSGLLPFQKTAMLGDGGPVMRYGTQILLSAIGMGDRIKYFEDRDEAIRWLKQA